MNSAFLERVQGFLKRKSVSHSVEFRVKKGDTPASSSSQFSMGVHSAARLGANVAAPPLKFQLVAAPTSRMATGSSVSVDALVVWTEGLFWAICPKAGIQHHRKTYAPASVNACIRIGSLRCNAFRFHADSI